MIFFFLLLKTQIVGTRENPLTEAVLKSTHTLCFRARIRKIMYTPVNPSVTILKWDVSGSTLHAHDI